MSHKERTSELKFRVPMGPSTKLNIETLNCHDPYVRYLYVLVVGNWKATLYAPGFYEADIGSYSSPDPHELKIQLYYGDGFWGEYSESIRRLCVSYDYRHVEVDWMAGYYQDVYYDHSQPQDVFDYVQAYYRTHDYRRIAFHPDESVGFEYKIDEYDFRLGYCYDHFDHMGQTRWSYALYVHYYEGHWGEAWPGLGFVVGDEISSGNLNGRTWVTTHEYGHVEVMDDSSGYKTDVYFTEFKPDGSDWSYWNTPHYPSNAWVDHLIWVSGWW